MRAQNNKEIYKGYLRFSLYLVTCVITGVLIYFCYTKTSNIEVNRIVEKTEEYDKIYVQQTELIGRIDSLYLYMNLFNTNLNDVQLQHTVSKRKQDIIASMEDMNGRDIRLFQKLMSEVNTFLSIKDSIRISKIEEELVRTDLLKCVEENKQTSRRLTIGNITLNQ
ncbi:type VI secretion system TssO [Dysgonomonas sp. ZJ279]|uniref:type VI secretion system TssO n=1 Tax=Dysgonomonas sp. ZJ279 TaxID=2709796 RepID=UPI0013EC395B|nr:type VI secretion system TssO [Dysgonomonas sp. ZJ279]